MAVGGEPIIVHPKNPSGAMISDQVFHALSENWLVLEPDWV